MSVKIGGLTVYVTFSFAVFLAVAANIAGGEKLLLSLLFSLIHEAVHLLFLRFSGIKKAEIKLFPAGVRIYCEGLNLLSHRKTVIASLSAPLFNIFSGAVFLFLHKLSGKDIFYLCSAVNFLLGSINLLPLSFLDGGRALSSVLSVKYEENYVGKVMNFAGLFSLLLLFSLFFIGFIMGRVQIFLLFFCVYCLLGTLSARSK